MLIHPSIHPSSRRRSEPIRTRVQASHFGTPPPPYSPTAPVEQTTPPQPVQVSAYLSIFTSILVLICATNIVRPQQHREQASPEIVKKDNLPTYFPNNSETI